MTTDQLTIANITLCLRMHGSCHRSAKDASRWHRVASVRVGAQRNGNVKAQAQPDISPNKYQIIFSKTNVSLTRDPPYPLLIFKALVL